MDAKLSRSRDPCTPTSARSTMPQGQGKPSGIPEGGRGSHGVWQRSSRQTWPDTRASSGDRRTGAPAQSRRRTPKMDVHGVFTLTGSERDAVERLPIQIHHLRADQDVVREGDRPTRCFALLDGFAASFKLTGEGKRQILAFISQVISRTSKAFTSRN